MSLMQPVSQVRLTNVAVVRLKKKGKRFELACYPNKVVSWREGNEADLDEVLQTHSVFTNVSKGSLAPSKDLSAAFGPLPLDDIILEILKSGALQVSNKERQHANTNTTHEIASLVADRLVDTRTQRPLTADAVERAMRDELKFAVAPGRPAKVQALEVIRRMKEAGGVERARMRVHVNVPVGRAKVVKEKAVAGGLGVEWEAEEFGNVVFEGTCVIDPGAFRKLDEIIKEETKGRGSIEVVQLAVVHDEEETLE